MKTTLVFIVLSCFAAVSFGALKCTQQSDCEEDECCLDTLFFRSAYCEPRYRAGQGCPAVSVYKPDTDLYYLACPCVRMYECLGKGSIEDGVKVVKDAKCIMPTI